MGKADSRVVRTHWAADSHGITGMLGVTPELPPTYSTPLPRGRHTTSRQTQSSIVGHDGIYGVPAGVYRATGRQSVTRIAVGLSAIPSPAGPLPALDLTRAANPGRGDKVLTI